MNRLSRGLVVILLVLMWTLFKTVFDINMVQKAKPSIRLAEEYQMGAEARKTMETKEKVPTFSKTRIKRLSDEEARTITLSKDREKKEEMTKYFLKHEAEVELVKLNAEINRLFHLDIDAETIQGNKEQTGGYSSSMSASVSALVTDSPYSNSSLENLLAHMMKEHNPAKHDYGYDVTESNNKPVNRTLPDFRPEFCRNKRYNLSSFPSVTVITPFHNEALTMLLRHLHALLNKSPPKLLKEIILVDDHSTLENLGEDFREYVGKLDRRIRIIRNAKREGVSRSRNFGADWATGDVLVFLDSHMECSTGWLEPMVSKLVSEPNSVLQPLLPGSIENKHFGLMRGTFDWELSYTWSDIPASEESNLLPGASFRSPTLTGCAIAITKNYFNHLGRFDPGMEIWGGEHFELAFRAWMCGGQVLTVPCSVIGHVYKLITFDFGGSTYTEVLSRNLLRVAEIWMDEYKEIIYASFRTRYQSLPQFTEDDWKSIKERRSLRQKLSCGSFEDFLQKFPEIKVPSKDDLYFGSVENANTSYCLEVQSDGVVGVGQQECGNWRLRPQEQFNIDKNGRLMYEDLCVVVDSDTNTLKATRDCIDYDEKWDLNQGRLELSGKQGTFCATHDKSAKGQNGAITMNQCDSRSTQIWTFAYKLDFGDDNKS